MSFASAFQDVSTSYAALEHWQKSLLMVVMSASVFIGMEYGMILSPVSSYLRKLLKSNPKLKDKDVETSIPLLITRIVGFIHNAFQVPIALWVISQPFMQTDRLHATSDLSHFMLCVAAGFFLHDAIACLLRESPFYIIHGASCCAGYTVAACFGVLHFFGGLFLLWELSTPFVQLRWALYKLGKTETWLYKANALLMALTFFLARIVAGTYFCGLLAMDTYTEITHPKPGSIPAPLMLIFCAIALTICSLNYWWFSKMVSVLYNIARGTSWTHASDSTVLKNE